MIREGYFWKFPCLLKKLKQKFGTTQNKATDEHSAAAEKMVKKETLAAFMLNGADRDWHQGLNILSQNYALSTNN